MSTRIIKVNSPRNINQISNLPAHRRIDHGGKNRAIPSWVWALESTPSESTHGLTPTLRRVTLTNLIAGPLGIMPVAGKIAKSQLKVTYPLAQGKVCGRGYETLKITPV